MKCKSIACLIILLNITAVIVLASSAYDSIECDPNSNRARKGRARLIQSIPCDLSKQNYCNLPGESYPWNAVKKFVYDNQGLVRRMYGDLRHIFVMQSEIENEIDFDDIKHTADKYSRAFNAHNKPNKHRQMKAKKVPTTTTKSTTTTTTTRKAERKNYRSGDAAEPHFRPAQRPSATNTKQRTKPPKVNGNDQNEKTSLIDNLIQTNVDVKSTTEKVASSTVTTTTSSTASMTTSNSSASENNNDDNGKRVAVNQKTYSEDESDRDKNETTVDTAVIDLFSNISSALSSAASASTVSTTMKETTTTSSTTTSTTASETTEKSTTAKNESETLEEEVEEILSELVDDSDTSASSTVVETVDDKGQSLKDPTTTTTEAQLYQDAMPSSAIPTGNKRGVNACPVKEEVVAPFWGNNTRGEILALLNVYPFEQYINWEKCTNEHEQMYCRKGCRCEQQYRLHRLLAYNPLDACRGIFSDWFRFPSCCICKCYDIPFDYRVTSRSPRQLGGELDEDDDDDDYGISQYVDTDNFSDNSYLDEDEDNDEDADDELDL